MTFTATLLCAAFLAAAGFCAPKVEKSGKADIPGPAPAPTASAKPTPAADLTKEVKAAKTPSASATAIEKTGAALADKPTALKNPVAAQGENTNLLDVPKKALKDVTKNVVDTVATVPKLNLPKLNPAGPLNLPPTLSPGQPPAQTPSRSDTSPTGSSAQAASGAAGQSPAGAQQSPAGVDSNLSLAKNILSGMPQTPDVKSALSLIDAYNRSGAAGDPSALNSAFATAGLRPEPAAAKKAQAAQRAAVPPGQLADPAGQAPVSIVIPDPGPQAKRPAQGVPIFMGGSEVGEEGLTDLERARMTLLRTDQLLEQNPNDVQARTDRAEALNILGDYDAAAEEATKALQLDPTSIKALNARAYANNKRGQYAFALQDADLVVKLAPGNAMGHLNRAIALEGLGRWDEALREYELAASLDPAMRALLRDAQARHSARAPAGSARAELASRPLVWAGVALLLAAGLPLGLWLRSRAGRLGPAPAREVDVGSVIGGSYRIDRLIGEGGMGKVFEGFDATIRRKVAVKMMRPELRRELGDAQILDEARLVALARHPNIVEIFAVLQEAGEIFLVFEFVAGRPLYAILQAKGRLPLAETAHILGQVAAGLDLAHAKRVIHRDLKPANVVISNEGVAKLMDFGIAHRSSAQATRESSQAGGTLPYMAPEQHQGLVCRESDLYALGVMAYELLTGSRPFDGPDLLELKQKASFPPASGRAPGLPPLIDGVLSRALAADPGARFHSGKEFIDALAG
ncbi:MAG: protein kinase [Elusimicrobia bacterium]|nr:protein kinase [Elusimicrobiota bacterium]